MLQKKIYKFYTYIVHIFVHSKASVEKDRPVRPMLRLWQTPTTVISQHNVTQKPAVLRKKHVKTFEKADIWKTYLEKISACSPVLPISPVCCSDLRQVKNVWTASQHQELIHAKMKVKWHLPKVHATFSEMKMTTEGVSPVHQCSPLETPCVSRSW